MVSRDPTGAHPAPSKAERRAARAAVGAYHEAELAKLLARVRDGLARYDAGEIDAFELDDLIHHYHRATQKLWSFCAGSGSAVRTARTLDWMREAGELPDWWGAAEKRAAPTVKVGRWSTPACMTRALRTGCAGAWASGPGSARSTRRRGA